MVHPQGRIKNLVRMFKQQPWPRSTANAPNINTSKLVEEENTPYYKPERFYPVRLGDILKDRYQIATKLGYGTNSTVWLARDLSHWRWQPERYVAIKVNALNHTMEKVAENELKISETISKSTASGIGKHFLRALQDSFTLDGPHGNHICLVFKPLREPLWLVKTRFKEKVIPPEVLKIMIEMILHALNYLHESCHIVHTDLKPDNILMKLESLDILAKDASDEFQNPLPQKLLSDRVIYLSRNNYGQPSAKSFSGVVYITDFGYSVLGSDLHYGPIQAEPFRAPEVILDAGWTYSSDIWNLGVMLWDLLEQRSLFDAVDPLQHEYDDRTHLALISTLFGAPPADLLARGRRTHLFYDSEGNLKPVTGIPDNLTLESTIHSMEGSEKESFLDFVRKMLKWRPEERSTAKELLDHPWLKREP